MFVWFLCGICFFLAWDTYLLKRAGAETTSLAPADLQDDLAEEVSEAALDCRESALCLHVTIACEGLVLEAPWS